MITKKNPKSYDIKLYQEQPQFVLGFHGCDESIAEKVLSSPTEHLKQSANTYDWLGNGIYFWLNDPQRAYEWACETQIRKPESIKTPAVVGAIIDLGLCLNLCERNSILLLQKSYSELSNALRAAGLDIHAEYENVRPDDGGFNLVRRLDCAVFQYLHDMVKRESNVEFDTVYGYFQEGTVAFPGAGVREKSHIQVCVRNETCIRGYFRPREMV